MGCSEHKGYRTRSLGKDMTPSYSDGEERSGAFEPYTWMTMMAVAWRYRYNRSVYDFPHVTSDKSLFTSHCHLSFVGVR